MAGASKRESPTPSSSDCVAAAGVITSRAATGVALPEDRLAFLYFEPSGSKGAAVASATASQGAAMTADFAAAEVHFEHFMKFIVRGHRPSLIYLVYALA